MEIRINNICIKNDKILSLNSHDYYQNRDNYLGSVQSFVLGAQIMDEITLDYEMSFLCDEKFRIQRCSKNGKKVFLSCTQKNGKSSISKDSPFFLNSDFEDENALLHNLNNIDHCIFESCEDLIKTELNLEVKAFQNDDVYVLRDYPFICAQLDGILQLPDNTLAGLDVKRSFYKSAWIHEKMPWYYWNQIQHYMMVTGLKRFFVITELCDEILIRIVYANDMYQKQLLEKMIDFWNVKGSEKRAV